MHVPAEQVSTTAGASLPLEHEREQTRTYNPQLVRAQREILYHQLQLAQFFECGHCAECLIQSIARADCVADT
jgi:hypothetical protein